MRKIIFTVAGLFMAVLAGGCRGDRKTAATPPNIIIVLADEAHRGQYGLTEKIKFNLKNENGNDIAERVIGIARVIRNSLPNATYVGFTGTPISLKDRSTREVFGDYIDIYDMTQSVEDGATRPVYYESRVIKLNLMKQQ